jgi:hypothetical protein
MIRVWVKIEQSQAYPLIGYIEVASLPEDKEISFPELLAKMKGVGNGFLALNLACMVVSMPTKEGPVSTTAMAMYDASFGSSLDKVYYLAWSKIVGISKLSHRSDLVAKITQLATGIIPNSGLVKP